jgi:site-specific DNA-methyltransferase (adenine-specific)
VRRGHRPPDDGGRTTSGVGSQTHGERWELIEGRCEEVLPLLPAQVFDTCITDPPYGLGIADWDGDVPRPEVWAEVWRVMKPGSWLLAFAGRRTYHRMATSIEEGGFKIVDMGLWIFRNGSRPPSRNHLRPAHEGIVIARAPGKPMPVNLDAGRTPWKDENDRQQTGRFSALRAGAKRRPVYAPSLTGFGLEPFAANDNGRLPTTVMLTGEDDVLGEDSFVFRVPKIRDAMAHVCRKPPELLRQLVNMFVPEGGVLLDPFAGSAPVVAAVEASCRRAVLIEEAAA